MYISRKKVKEQWLYEKKRYKTLNLLWAILRKDYEDINHYIKNWEEFKKPIEEEVRKSIEQYYPSFEDIAKEIEDLYSKDWGYSLYKKYLYKRWKDRLDQVKTEEDKKQLYEDYIKFRMKIGVKER